jgi:acetyl-CoA carboxylase carboxyltransferase component
MSEDTPEQQSPLRPELLATKRRLANTLDECRQEAKQRRHAKGYRTARENLADLVDADSFIEHGQLTVAAQRSRRDYKDLQTSTAADGVITGLGTINSEQFGADESRAAVVVYDFSVLAGTQGFFHHQKLDRIFELAEKWQLPVVMYTEGGGGRPGDTDVTTQIAGLNIHSFVTWARLSGKVPRIAINNGYCFAGNAALFGCADITIATRSSWIGMAGPAMIEGGGLGVFPPTEIGPIEVQEKNGVVDIVVEDEAEATATAKRLVGFFQGQVTQWEVNDQLSLRAVIPEDRRWGYPVRKIINTLADKNSFIELRRIYGRSIITGFIRLEGKPVGLIANDCQQLGGAVDAEAAEKAARFLQLCDAFALPVVSLTDTPGFMVGPDSEQQAAVRRMSSLFVSAASVTVPIVGIFLRKGYGLGAMAMVGGSFASPVYSVAWPTGEFGGMGLEGAVRLGYKKELDAEPDELKRQALFDQLVAAAYESGKATEAAAHLEIDGVIDPADTRQVIIRALRSAGDVSPPAGQRRPMVDTW